MDHTEAPKKTKATPLAACPFMTVAITGHLVHRLTKNLNIFLSEGANLHLGQVHFHSVT
jgi:hypothetical protein